MAGQKDKNVVCVVAGLTNRQASEMIAGFAREKNRIAPQSRSTAAISTRENIGKLLSRGTKLITGKK